MGCCNRLGHSCPWDRQKDRKCWVIEKTMFSPSAHGYARCLPREEQNQKFAVTQQQSYRPVMLGPLVASSYSMTIMLLSLVLQFLLNELPVSILVLSSFWFCQNHQPSPSIFCPPIPLSLLAQSQGTDLEGKIGSFRKRPRWRVACGF